MIVCISLLNIREGLEIDITPYRGSIKANSKNFRFIQAKENPTEKEAEYIEKAKALFLQNPLEFKPLIIPHNENV